eukprot:20826-Amphidinium_carterae.1
MILDKQSLTYRNCECSSEAKIDALSKVGWDCNANKDKEVMGYPCKTEHSTHTHRQINSDMTQS